MLCYQFCVGLNCAVVVFRAPGSPVGAEEGVMIHTWPPQVLTGLGTGQIQRHLTVLGLSLQYTEFGFFVILHNETPAIKVSSPLLCNLSCSGCIYCQLLKNSLFSYWYKRFPFFVAHRNTVWIWIISCLFRPCICKILLKNESVLYGLQRKINISNFGYMDT